jgi:hypothetical protein
VLQFDSISFEEGEADAVSLAGAESGGAAATCNNVTGISWCSVETGSGAGGTSGIPAESDGSGVKASGTGATGCSSINAGD